MAKLPTRSRKYGVGKEIGGAVYVHRQYETVFGDVVATAREKLTAAFEYQVVKYDARRGNISFVSSPDFDTADEPIVSEIITIKPGGAIKRRKQSADPEIYHHKWLFVSDDYSGFDVLESRRRSLRWLSLDGVDAKRIGRLSYWEEQVVTRLLDG